MGFFADTFNNVNNGALKFSDNIVRFVLPKSTRESVNNAVKNNLITLEVARQSVANVPNLLQNERPDITWDECNFTWVSDYGIVSYRNPYCKPSTVVLPSRKERQLRDLDLSKCGQISFTAVYCTKVLGVYWVPNADNTGGHEEKITVSSSLEEIYTDYKKAYPDGMNFENFPFINGGSGITQAIQISTGITYRTYHAGGGEINTNGVQTNPPFGVLSFPYHVISTYEVEITGSTANPAINAILDNLGTAGVSPTIFRLQVSGGNNLECPLGKPSPPPPPRKKECECMCCPRQENNDVLLKLILKRIGSLPADVPASYLTKNGVQPAQIKQVESLTEFIAWFAERFDETLGEFEITIEVDDVDLTKEGQQKQTIRLPNLAESIAEMFSMMIHSNINNELILNIVNRTLIESGQIKQSKFKTYSALNAVIDYLGFHTTSQVEKMPLSFTAGEKSFDKFLKESEQNVSVLVYKQKETLTAIMQSLLQAAAIIRAVHYRRTSGNQQKIASTVKEDLLKLLGESGNITDQIKAFITNIEKVYDGVDSQPK